MTSALYTPQTWANGSQGNTPANAFRLTHMENGIVSVANAVLALQNPASLPETSVTGLVSDLNARVKKDVQVVSVLDHGAVGDGVRLRTITASTSSPVVTVASGNFSAADIGKMALVYTDTAAGTLTTIISVQSATQVTLAANAGISTSDNTSYFMYGTDNSTAITSALTLADTLSVADITVGPNEPQAGGQPIVWVPPAAPGSWYLLSSAITIPSGVMLDAVGMLVNMLADRFAPCVIASPYSSIRRLYVECLFGTGIQLGQAAGTQADVHAGTIVLWHVGKTQEGSGLLRGQDGIALLGYGFLIDLAWMKGGFRGIYHNAGSDCVINRGFVIGAITGVSLSQTNQFTYNQLVLDSCGQVGGGSSGVTMDNACTHGKISVMAFEVTGISPARVLDNVVLVGAISTNKCVDLHLEIQAQVTGGAGLKLNQAQDVLAHVTTSNTATPSSGGSSMTTAVVYGTSVAGYCNVVAGMNGTVTPYSGTLQGALEYHRAGVRYSVSSGTAPTGAALAANGTSAPAVTVTGNDQRGKASFGSGTGPTTGSQITITFASGTGWIGSTFYPLISPLNAATAALQPYIASCTATVLTIGFGVAPTASQTAGTYQLNYRMDG